MCTPCARRGSSCTFGGRPAETSGSSSSHTSPSNESGRKSDAAELLALLTSASSNEDALKLLAEIKSYDDVSISSRQIKIARGLLPADGGTLLSPPDQESVQFELMARHFILYPAPVPLDLSFTFNNLKTDAEISNAQGTLRDARLEQVKFDYYSNQKSRSRSCYLKVSRTRSPDSWVV